jgi:S-adenosylmethionine/arginine decarboxylase-like enzyme
MFKLAIHARIRTPVSTHEWPVRRYAYKRVRTCKDKPPFWKVNCKLEEYLNESNKFRMSVMKRELRTSTKERWGKFASNHPRGG